MRRRGSTVIVSVLVAAFALIGISALLTSSYLAGFQLGKSEFRGTVTQISSSSRGAVAIALADVTKELNLRVKTAPPSPYHYGADATLSAAEVNLGYSLLSQYQTSIRQSYPGTGLIINYIDPIFECNWTSPDRTGYSKAHANATIDVPNLGFSGLDNYVEVESRVSLRSLVNTDGTSLQFTFNVTSEGGNLVDNLDKSLISVFQAKNTTRPYNSFTEITLNSIQYTGGVYAANCESEYETIDANVANITSIVNASTFSSKSQVLDKLTEVTSKYASYHGGDRSQPWLSSAWTLMYDARAMVISDSNATWSLIGLMNITLSQLRPTVRIVVTDFRGVTSSAFGECGDDPMLPLVLYEKATPSGGGWTLTTTADNHLGDGQNILGAEYYFSDSASSIPPGAEPHAMSAVDGAFNEPIEGLTASIATLPYPGTNYIWMHARDTGGHWSDYVKVKVSRNIYLDDIDAHNNVYIDMEGDHSGSGSGAKYWATARVKVVDENGNPVSGATVWATWSGSYSSTTSKVTSATGECTFETTHQKYSDWPTILGYKVFTITISSVTKTGYAWVDPSPPGETDTIRLNSSRNWVY